MNLFYTNEELIDFMFTLAKRKPKKVFLSTFNIAALKYKNKGSYDLLEYLEENKIPTEIHVGYSLFRECTPNCQHCRETFMKNMISYQSLKARFKTFKWVFHPKLHLKAYVFAFNKKKSIVITGGMNLTNSNFEDVAFTIDLNLVTLRKWVANIRNSEVVEPENHRLKKAIDEDYVFKTGKHANKTLKHVLETDIGYVKFILEKGFFGDDMKQLYYKFKKLQYEKETT